ncbi:MAG: tripartite tricarboxylate transporter substrate binding protein [Firmicutes bacterium]|nr:tripartite tricarboxylate transporter substrate binding protein [Bacillota bacterium]
MKRFMNLLLVSLILGLLATSVVAAADWKPTRDIEFVVPSSAGGGSDLNARTISDLARKYGFSPSPIMVVNKPGGSGAVAFSYVNTKKGDAHTLMVLHSGQAVGAYVNDWRVKTEDLTYIGTVAFDELTLGVRKDSPYKDVPSLIEAAKKNPGKITIGGAQRGNSDHLCFELINKYTEGEFSYVMFNSSGEVMSAVLGGHVDVGIFNPTECIGQVQAGEIIPIATFAANRLGGLFADAPTFGELGYPEIQVTEVRAIAGPPNMPKEAVEFYEEMLLKVTETEEWKRDYIERNLLIDQYMNAADTQAYFEDMIDLNIKTFKEVGYIK